ncbi:acyl-CoA thioesterase [Actinomadura alba]|uniref:Acyl-CoA thioesterase n=1 Tax=Actinomadura alba TaxID=406431 RepID=A0ABR7LSU0_9ACTN|nr:thioesterase family protein [Actinomadura alba]MBC6467844.1 acyl-CoA thioesterase [Actinomadura alba]
MGEIFTHRVRVRYAECDAQGVLFNGQYLFLYDVAVTELWRAAGSTWAAMVGAGHDVVVAEARIRFREGARFDELVDIRLPIAHLGTSSMVIRPTFTVDDRLIADGEVRHVFIDPATKRKKEMPSGIRAAFQHYLMADG